MSQEFKLIDQYFLPLSDSLLPGDIGIGDDGAVMTPPANHQLVVVTDTLVEGVHFTVDALPKNIAWKAVAVNLSDLAAMGAKPGFISLALTLPKSEQAWLASFTEGLKDVCRAYQVPLIGGDTTKGPLTITVTAHGWVEQGRALLRSGAQLGDIVAVSGYLGDASLGLKIVLNQLTKNEQACFDSADVESCLQAHSRPQPQLELGRLLQGYATSAIDVSDGLLADLTHIIEHSNMRLQSQGASNMEGVMDSGEVLGAELYLDSLPLSPAMRKWFKLSVEWQLPLSAGDDYQLCFTVKREHWHALMLAAETQGLQISKIGEITNKPGVFLRENSDSKQALSGGQTLGYQHF